MGLHRLRPVGVRGPWRRLGRDLEVRGKAAPHGLAAGRVHDGRKGTGTKQGRSARESVPPESRTDGDAGSEGAVAHPAAVEPPSLSVGSALPDLGGVDGAIPPR